LFDIENLKNEINSETIFFLKEAANELDYVTRSIVEEANKSKYNIQFKKHRRNLY
jgi:hypothetical protein